MPRQARLDAPGTLHHVIVRGIERGKIVADRQDRAAFIARMGNLAITTQTSIYAWALLPNHAHLLLRSGPQGLPKFMTKLVTDLAHLDRYPWCGHAALVGRAHHGWQDRKYVLAWFGRDGRTAIPAYRKYMLEGLSRGRRPELVGGGLVRSLGSWAEVRAMRRRTERTLTDERILGSGDFVEQRMQAADDRLKDERLREQRLREAATVIRKICQRENINPEELRAGSQRKRVSKVRGQIAVELVTGLGLPLADVARRVGVSTSGISKALSRATK